MLIPILELRADGDIALVNIKQAGAKLTLKDMQLYLKKKMPPSFLTTYSFAGKKLSFFGYTKGKKEEDSQHQLPPPYEAPGLFGSILIVAHSAKSSWDGGLVEQFLPTEYEAFFEKGCAGELGEEEEEEEEEVVEEEEAEEEEEEVPAVEEDEEVELEVDVPVEDEEEAPRPTRARKIVKIDPQQLQFQFVSVLKHQGVVDTAVVEASKHRQSSIELLTKLCSQYCNPAEILQLELGIYNASLEEGKRRMTPLTWEHEQFRWIYSTTTRRVVSNFLPNSYVGNQNLMKRWKEGEFTLDALGSLSNFELNPGQWKDLKDQQFRREQRILEGNVAMATDRFRCSRCKKKMCTFYELQTRSADEPMTIFVTCVNCGKQWRQ